MQEWNERVTETSSSDGMDCSTLTVPVKVRFRHMEEAPELTSTAQRQADRLTHFHLNNPHCSIIIDKMHHRKHSAVYEVRAQLNVTGRTYHAHSAPVKGELHDVHEAIAEVIDALERQIEKIQSRRLRRRTAAIDVA